MFVRSSLYLFMFLYVYTKTQASTDTRVIGGSTTHITRFPYVVSLRRRPCEGCAYKHYCGGVIYKAHIIFTTANCVKGAQIMQLQIVAGSNYRTGAANDGAIYPIERIVLHENVAIDIAILYLALAVPLNNITTKAVTLATEVPSGGDLALVAGWGQFNELSDNSESLKLVHVPIIEQALCRRLYSWQSITEHEICAGFLKGGSDACQGDAGSPLIVNNSLVGIVSWGNGCARANNPGVYTNIVSLRTWITNQS